MATARDIFDRILPRFAVEAPRQGFLDAVAHTVKHIDTRLFTYGSDLLRKEVELGYEIGEDYNPIPSSYLGMVTPPKAIYADGTVTTLVALPEDLRWTFTSNGTTKYYELRGSAFFVYPSPEAAMNVKFLAMSKNSVAAMEDEIPYAGLFDDLIAEMALRFSIDPISAIIDQTIQHMVVKEMDAILLRRTKKNIYFKHPA